MNLPNDLSLPDKFKLLRKLEGLSQAALAELSGVPQSTIASLEKGRGKTVGVSVLAKIAAVPSLFPYSMWLLAEGMTEEQIQASYDFLKQLQQQSED